MNPLDFSRRTIHRALPGKPKKSLAALIKAAEKGDPMDQYMAGAGYWFKANPDAADTKAGLAWFKKAADAGMLPAVRQVAIAYDYGNGVKKDRTKALSLYLRVVENTADAIAAKRLGEFYLEGEVVPRDVKKAIHWLHLAAEHEMPECYGMIGDLYEKGDGVKKNLPKAFQWFVKGAFFNDPHCLTRIGVMYTYGLGVTKDISMGNIHMLEACNFDHPEAYFEVARDLETSMGESDELVLDFYKNAAKFGHTTAAAKLKSLKIKRPKSSRTR